VSSRMIDVPAAIIFVMSCFSHGTYFIGLYAYVYISKDAVKLASHTET